MEDETKLQAALDLVRRTQFLSISSLDERGYPETRLVFNLQKMRAKAFEEGASLANPFATYIGTNTSSRKVAQVRRDGRACLYYSDSEKYEGLSVRGTLVEVLDPALRAALWTPAWKVYYVGGLDGGDFTVLRFDPLVARYYHGLAVAEFDCAAKA